MLSALVVFCLAAQAAADDARVEKLGKIQVLTQKGIDLFKAKEYEKALGVFQEAEKLMPEHPGTAYNIACAHSLMGKKKEAFESLFKAIKLGYLDLQNLTTDEDLASLRGEKEWADVVAAMKAEIARREAEMSKAAREEMRKALAAPEPLFAFTFDLKDVEGAPLTLAALRSKVVLVDIWGTWCGPCRREVPHLIALAKKYEGKGLAIVGLSIERGTPEEGAKAVKEFIKTTGIKYPCAVIDRKLLEQVPDWKYVPTLLLLDREGKVRLTHIGYSPPAVLEAWVEELLAAGKSPAEPAKEDVKGKAAKKDWFTQ